jgi:TonB family protein
MSFFIECSVRVTAVMAATLVAILFLRRQPAAFRHLVWTGAFGIAALTPLLFAIGPKTIHPIVVAPPIEIRALTIEADKASKPSQGLPVAGILAGIWSAGVLICIIKTGRSLVTARCLRRDATKLDAPNELPLEIPDSITVAKADRAKVAMTLGIRAPLIVLPANYRQWPVSRLRVVLLHELAHVRRRDCLLQWLPQIVCALHWFNPLAWFAREQMLCEAERASDDAVLLDGASGAAFARDLLDIAETSGLKGADPMFITITTRIERRIAQLLNASTNRKPLTHAHVFGALVLVVAALLPLAAIRAQDSTQTGTLSGVVTDPTGAVIANATINISGPSGNVVVAVDPVGSWTARNLPPGTYQVEVSVPGFAVFRQTNITVSPGGSIQVRQPLAIGQMAERITVQGSASSSAVAVASAPARRIRVGGNVQAARLISRTSPVYPAESQQQGVQAVVLIQAIIGKDGNVLNPRVVGTGIPAELAQAALDAVRTWQYEPTRLNGEPVEAITTITVNFQLH